MIDSGLRLPINQLRYLRNYRMTNGFAGMPCAYEIQVLLVSRYSRMDSTPLSRPMPECFMPPNGIM